MTLQPSATQPADPQVPETSAAVFLIDPAGVITGWSPAAAGITGYTAAEIIGGGLSLLYSPEERSAGNPSADVALAARVGRSAREGWLLRKDGGKIWTDTAITALRSSVGTVSGFACFIRDRAREQAADARRRARAERISALAVSREDVATHGLDIVKLLRRIALRARELTGAEAAIIELRDGVGERARAYDGHGPLDVELGAILIPEGRTRSNGRLQCIRYDGGSESAEVLADACDRLGIGSLLAIPVLHEHATIAWIAVLSRSARTFDEQAAATLELTSTLLGASLAQAQASEQRRAQIHERSMAEAQQRGRDARLRDAMDASPDALFLLAAVRAESGAIIDFALLDANRRGEELGALVHDAFAGLRLAALPAVALQLPPLATMVDVIERGGPLAQERESVDASGAVHLIRELIVPLGDGVVVTRQGEIAVA